MSGRIDSVLGWLRSREGAGCLCTSLGPELERVVPARYKRHAHHWLILHGRYVCKARRPDCPACVVRDLCGYKAKTTPSRSNSSPKQPRRAAATLIRRQRPARGASIPCANGC